MAGEPGSPESAFPLSLRSNKIRLWPMNVPPLRKGSLEIAPKIKEGIYPHDCLAEKSDLHSLLMVNREHAARGLLVVSDGADGFTGRVLFQLNEVSTLPAPRR